MSKQCLRFMLWAALMAVGPTWLAARELTFAERLEAQRAIEGVSYSHQIGADKPLDKAVPRDVLEKKVRTYLEQSAALELIWNTPVTGEMLRTELERIARATWFPERLSELYRALGNDPFVVEECLARATLVGRLARSRFAHDPDIHAAARLEAETSRLAVLRERDAFAGDPRWTVLVLVRGEEGVWGARSASRDRGQQRVELAAEEFRQQRALFPDRVGEVGPLVDEPEAFLFRVVLDESPVEVRVATFAVPKHSWERWWEGVAAMIDASRVMAVASGIEPLPAPRGRGEPFGAASGTRVEMLTIALCQPGGGWDNGSLGLPDPRSSHTAVWTGSKMVVWGGSGGNTGSVYDPATDTWAPTSTTGAPSGRSDHTAVWTGGRMVVWGGVSDEDLNTGGVYDLATDTWTPTSTTGAPSARNRHTAVWTGSRMVVWGGDGGGYLNTGGMYDPGTDTWAPTSTTAAPSGRFSHTAVWTGSRMVVWGGYRGNYLGTGGTYDPTTNSWSLTSTSGAPSARNRHTAVWTGSRMVVWGGDGGGYLNTGGLYDPGTDTWSPTSTAGAPSGRNRHTVVWTGSRMVVWGGYDGQRLDTGALYDPEADTWSPTSPTGAPSARRFHTAVWTGSRMAVWGGFSNEDLNTGGLYDPANDTWTPAPTVEDVPSARYRHTAVWTGSRMVVWGGSDGGAHIFNTGGLYDPVTDTWAPTSTTEAPLARQDHTAVWTGSRMVVWGGRNHNYSLLNTGGAYDPATDTWAPTSTAGAPAGRIQHTAVWTGSRMVVWGGEIPTGPLSSSATNTGGVYDPATHTWASTSTMGAPSSRQQHTALWTGSRMVVWGGVGFNTGGVYDPANDTWTPTSTAGAPAGRTLHTAIWTGSRMVVWGGLDNSFLPTNTGGLYEAITDTWAPTSMSEAPSGRLEHTAIWTGSRMVVWGGVIVSGPSSYSVTDTGGLYDPGTNNWVPTSTAGAPSDRALHTAVWTGGRMVVWGGYTSNSTFLNSGGAYRPSPPPSLRCTGVRHRRGR